MSNHSCRHGILQLIVSASDQNEKPRSAKEDIRIAKEVKQPKNILEKSKVRINSSNITDNRKFHKIKTYSEAVKEKETKWQNEKVFDLEIIVLRGGVSQPCVVSPPLVCCDENSSDKFVNINFSCALIAQSDEFLKNLEELESSEETSDNTNSSNGGRLNGFFFSDADFNLSKWVLSETKIKIFEKD